MVCTLGPHRDIPWPEEELTIEVGLLNGVHVGDYHFAVATGQSHHGKVLQELTADGTCPNLERSEATKYQAISCFGQWPLKRAVYLTKLGYCLPGNTSVWLTPLAAGSQTQQSVHRIDNSSEREEAADYPRRCGLEMSGMMNH